MMIQKTIKLAVATISFAMLGATIMASYTPEQKAFATGDECINGLQKCWCYNRSDAFQQEYCYPEAHACKQAQSTDPTATSKCFRGHP
jgi:hypothetical protein